MKKMFRTGRVFLFFLLLAAIILIFFIKLYQLQIRDGGSSSDQINTYSTTETIASTRGDILDRNGTLLVTSKVSYDISLSRDTLLEQDDPNTILLNLARTAEDCGVEYTDTFPITPSAPYVWLADTTSSQQTALADYIEYFGLDPEISATDFIVWLRSHYGIDYTVSTADARTIIGLRYELESHVITPMNAYVFASDVSTDFISIINERNYPGVSVETRTSRVYTTEYAAHILGYLGKMNEEEYEEYKEDGYPLNAYVGKDGVEKAFESYLHGSDGSVRVYYSEDTGAVVSTEVLEPAVNGNNVYLSLDIGIQQTAENALAEKIDEINADRTSGDMVSGGAVVVTDVRDGGVLALASWPTYDISTFFDNYSELASDSSAPLFNRAVNGTYNPGSTFKMVTGYAGLKSGKISPYTIVNDTGIFTKYESYQPVCWIYNSAGVGHGEVDLINALRYSCNVYFYTVGDTIGADALAAAAAEFGFGDHTGIETGDSVGLIASSDYKEDVLNETWYAADTLLASIGQGLNMFTPIQLANYAATIANGGIRHSMTLLDSVRSSDYTETVYEQDAEVAYEFSDTDKSYFTYLQQGMEAVANMSGGTGYSLFSDYKVKVACKTGTVQTGTGNSNTGVFVCYAPADDPEIAISVVIERGSSGSTVMSIAQTIMDYYFGTHVESVSIADEGSLLP